MTVSSPYSEQSSAEEHVRYEHQGALFRVVTREVSGLDAVYVEIKRSCDDDWQHHEKLGWAADGQEVAYAAQ